MTLAPVFHIYAAIYVMINVTWQLGCWSKFMAKSCAFHW